MKIISSSPLCSWTPGVALRHPAHIPRIPQEYQAYFATIPSSPALCERQSGKFKIPAALCLLLPGLPASCLPLHPYSLCTHDRDLFSHLENTLGHLFTSDSGPTSLTKPSWDSNPLQLHPSPNTWLCETKCAQSCLGLRLP